MPRPTRTHKSKPGSPAKVANRYKLPTRKKRESEKENIILQPSIGNVDDDSSLLSSSSGDMRKTKVISKNDIGRPPLPRKKVTKKIFKKKEKEGDQNKERVSPLQKRFLNLQDTPTIAPGSRTPIRSRRREAATKKKQYVDINSDTDNESSSSEESEDDGDYSAKNEKKIKTQAVSCDKKANKRKIGTPTAIKADKKKQKVKTPSPLHSKKKTTPSGIKKVKSSPSVGLTPIKESISKVWENDDGDWRVQGAIDYNNI